MNHFYSDLLSIVPMVRGLTGKGYMQTLHGDHPKSQGTSSREDSLDDKTVSSGLEAFIKDHQAGHAQPFTEKLQPLPIKPLPRGSAAQLPQLSFDTLESIQGAIKSCNRCSRCQERQRPVPGNGAHEPKVLIIGEEPGIDDDTTGLAFAGGAGEALDKWLEAIGISRYREAYLTTLIKCRGSLNAKESWESCRGYFENQVKVLKPRAILIVGTGAAKLLGLQQSQEISEIMGVPVMVTYHPAEVTRDPQLKRPVWEALKLFKARCL